MDDIIPGIIIEGLSFVKEDKVQTKEKEKVEKPMFNRERKEGTSSLMPQTGPNLEKEVDSLPTIYAELNPFVPVQQNVIGISAQSTFPMEPGSEANVYMPVAIDTKDIQIVSRDNGRQSKGKNTAAMLYKELIKRCKIRAYKGSLYLFDDSSHIYRELPDLHLGYLININFGREIERENNLYLYDQISEYLKKDAYLVVHENCLLPLSHWGFRNGFFNIKTGESIVNDGSYFIRSVLTCDYNPYAVCPVFDKFIYAVAGGDENIITLLWQTIGYLLSHDTRGKVFFSFVGKKDTGKSLLANVITRIVGEDAISYLAASDFSGRFDVSELNGKTLNVCMDLPKRPLSAEAVGKIKAITGGDMIRSDVKFKDAIRFKPTARLLFGSNDMISSVTYDPAFFDRMVVIPFLHQVPKEHQDHTLEEKLCSEAEGICQKALKYYCVLLDQKYRFVRVEMREPDVGLDYEAIIGKFAGERCLFTKNTKDRLSTVEVFNAFDQFCFSLSIPSITCADFSRKFAKMFSDKVEKKKMRVNGESVNGYSGIRWKLPTDNALIDTKLN